MYGLAAGLPAGVELQLQLLMKHIATCASGWHNMLLLLTFMTPRVLLPGQQQHPLCYIVAYVWGQTSM
jgi:hypothetical protein